MIRDVDDREVLWHDGGTGGFRTRIVRHLRLGDADRHVLARSVAGAVAVLALTRALVAWERVPVAIWNPGAGFAPACLLAAVLAWPTTRSTRGSRPVRRGLATLLLIAWNASLAAPAC